MKLRIKSLKLSAGRPVAILHKKTAESLNLHIDDRIIIKRKFKKIIAVLDFATGMLKQSEIAVSLEILKALEARENEIVDVTLAFKPRSINLIYKKLFGKKLSKKEIRTIIKDVVENALTEAEIAYFVSAMQKVGMSEKELEFLTEAIAKSGKILKLKGKIIDKHSVSGVAGNRTTPIIVSICASVGLIMPKTSSRAITSAAGTADVMESICKVEFPISKIKKILKKTNACIVWGGSLGLAPADDKIIQVERLLNLDPWPQLIASIMAKKIAVSAKYVLIDIPYGKKAKVENKKSALQLKRKFEKLARHFKINLKCVLTDGSQPIGNGIGPILEIRDVISVLKNKGPEKLRDKSLFLSGKLLELCGKAKKNDGKKMAEAILISGMALKKFQEIIKAQHGNLRNLKLAKFSKDVLAKKNSKIKAIDNKKISYLARLLGSPADKSAGIYIWKHKPDKVKKGEKIITIYAESTDKLKQALSFYKRAKPITF